ncbi:hypothetical protein OEZ85_003951 [Tetradesmus obliquus]|uniref:Uncharacterized protein n=1 Tax=Tetradesmus obliquus TaxID=3088 RepID=A0ABY8UCX7_TETOB|nr:hypothetical protein OEZ85_003951 [Tetradesmus obliquus]
MEEAAVVLQAAARGYLTRKQLQQQREREEQAAVLIQAGARGMLERRRLHAILQEQQQQQQQQQQPPGYSSLSASMLPSYGSSGAVRGSGSAGSNGRKGSQLPSPAGLLLLLYIHTAVPRCTPGADAGRTMPALLQ